MTDLAIELGGESVRLLPERAIYWERAHALTVADLHWGKAATFRAAGVPIPAGTTADDLARLDRTLARTAARRLILLGDLYHARAGHRAETTRTAASAWRARHPDLDVLLVRGNHDLRAGDPPADLGVTVVDAPHPATPFELRHEPGVSESGYTLAGHIHPCYVMSGAGRQWERLPCFVVGARAAILPAFGSFTGTVRCETRSSDRIYVIAGDDVLAVR
ncbi:MAG: ligase-associated DNA damage response endonuclease PdeM [Gemmatimonadales bacterium]|nr:ligase-associated DNA damage response endonuclease PdeM [Gemmatimonadales bacterium]